MNQELEKSRDERSMKGKLRKRLRALKELGIQERKRGWLVVLVLLFLLAGVTVAQLSSQQGVPSSGTVKVIGVSLFWDKACTSSVTSVTWGLITPGTSTSKYVYVRNDGTATGKLSMSYGNWTPAAAAPYLILTWNCSDYALRRGAVVCANLTLTAQLNMVGITDFSLIILIQVVG